MNRTLPIKSIGLHIIYFLSFSALNKVVDGVPFSTALYVGLLFFEPMTITLTLSFLLSFIFFGAIQMWICGAIISVVLCVVFSLYRSKNKLPNLEIVCFIALSLLYFILQCGDLVDNSIYSAVICLFSYISFCAVKFVTQTAKHKTPETLDTVSVSIILSAIGVGFIRLTNVNVYLSFAVLTLMITLTLTKNTIACVVAGILALPTAITENTFVFFATFFVWFSVAVIFIKYNHLFSSLAVMVAEVLLAFVVEIYPTYTIYRAIFITVPLLFFAFLPKSLFNSINNKITFSPRELLCKNYVNRSRVMLSSKLYEISGVFFQMQTAMEELKKCIISRESIVNKVSSECVFSICSECVMQERCQRRAFPDNDLINRLVDLGISKNRLTLIDLPREFTETCTSTNSFIFEINRLIGAYSEQIKSLEGVSEAKQLISLQVEGLAKIMKAMAFEFSKTLPNNNKLEKKIFFALRRYNLFVTSVLILGEENETEICIFTDLSTSENPKLKEKLSYILNSPVIVSDKTPFSDSLIAVTFKHSPKLDAVFGICSRTKFGSTKCGDVHSLTKISEGKFLVALSDGMGTGESANATSSTSLNLIESFYRAELDSEMILSTVNKVLSLNVDDNFSAVDIGVVDLYKMQIDFIKIGAPYGFLLKKNGISYIEGSSLPLGILDELKPASCTVDLSCNDVIIMISDGVSDAFGSSSDMIEFLNSAPSNNPQALAESIIDKALYYNDNQAKDDMTALCVRIIEKIA